MRAARMGGASPVSAVTPRGGTVAIVSASPFGYPYLYGPSLPFYWQPQVQPIAPPPRYICKKRTDEQGEEELVCEVDPESFPAPRPLLTYPLGGRWFV